MQLSGYLIFLSEPHSAYRGVDRSRFEPAFGPEINHPGGNPKYIYQFQTIEWKRKAMQIYEEGCLKNKSIDSIDLIAQLKTAESILPIIEPHLGQCEILSVDILSKPSSISPNNQTFLGIDVAYPGGDLFSAIKQGVLFPGSSLKDQYLNKLNPNGLFQDSDMAAKYLIDFRLSAPSETTSKFHFYSLSEPG